ncbi:OmpA family protein [Winogradskyella sp.]|uniref:OmpA family protein n=1 Tax=Winogradskyella sp. TaxID=1883156 RepID=UPI003F6CB6FF
MAFNRKKLGSKGLFIMLLLFFITFQSAKSQENSALSFSAGINIIDNSNGIDAPWDAERLEFKKPVFAEIEYRSNNWSISLMATSNQFKLQRLNEAGDGFVNNYYDFFALDITNKFYLDQYILDNEAIDLYAGVGLGAHKVAEGKAITANLSLGANYWVTDQFGIVFQAFAKKGFDDEVLYVGNYYQYNLGLSYRLKSKTKDKPEEEPVEDKPLDAAKEKEVLNVPTIVNGVVVEKGELEDAVKQDQSEKEQDVVKEKAPVDVLAEQLEAIGPVYFDRNSSYYDGVGRAKLSDIYNLLKSNPSLNIRIDSYTDSKGTEAYNEFLSDRRLNRVRQYLIGLGINPSRLQGVSNGVDTNSPCIVQNRSCTEQEYAQQRRVEFTVKSQ